jgi:hypothetical protein
MKKVVIGVNPNGEYYVISCPKKIIVEFKQQKKKTLKRKLKTIWYKIKARV